MALPSFHFESGVCWTSQEVFLSANLLKLFLFSFSYLSFYPFIIPPLSDSPLLL
ncbi:hypothetical protein CSUI_005931 [Cystoisospora suis]|uniref:Uncharacterized protein n=1 Tax=Cystoisospora suis TaxID=483139 RepID=A0A2C6KS38_9APIC|nr:hypothetical protein CSUI_005931 [Cystoisospora suis]